MGRGQTGGIDATIERVTSSYADGYAIQVAHMPEPLAGWLPADRFLASDDLKADLLGLVMGVRERPADHICAEWMVESWARALADLAGSFMVSDRRLPDLDPENLLVAQFSGMFTGVAVRTEAMSALEDDEAAIVAGADPADDWTDLAGKMYRGLSDLYEPVIAWADAEGLRPWKTLWHSTGDRLAQSLVWSGKAYDERRFALELTEHLMGLGGDLAVPVERDIDDAGEPYHLRSTCCLAYRTPEGTLCRACPLNK